MSTKRYCGLSKQLIAWMLLLLLLHAVLAAVMGLSVDEAHYALYALHPAMSYFDHPPLVGWIQIPFLHGGAPVWAIRLIPEVIWLMDAALIFSLANRLEKIKVGEAKHVSVASMRAGVWAVLAFTLAPIFHVLGIGLLPDTLLTFWALCLAHVALNVLKSENDAACSAPSWLLLGILVGLAGLSKYTAVLPVFFFVVLVIAVQRSSIFKNPFAYLAVLIAAAMVAPVLLWNERHQWISFDYQLNHGTDGSWNLLSELRFLLLQMLVYGFLPLAGLWQLKKSVPVRNRPLLLVLAVAPFVFMAYFAGKGSSLPYWTAPFWGVLCAYAGCQLSVWFQIGGWRKCLLNIVVVLQATIIFMCCALIMTAGFPITSHDVIGQGNAVHPSNPFADVYGWQKASEQAKKLAKEYALDRLSVQNWTLASRLAWYAKPMHVYVLNDGVSQFTLWFGNMPKNGNSLLVRWSQLDAPLPVGADGFKTCLEVGRYDVRRLGDVISYFHFYACYHWLEGSSTG